MGIAGLYASITLIGAISLIGAAREGWRTPETLVYHEIASNPGYEFFELLYPVGRVLA